MPLEDARGITHVLIMAKEAILIFPSVTAFFVQEVGEIHIEGGWLTLERLIEILFHVIHLLLLRFSGPTLNININP
jgi:hypothetical protein